MAVEGYERMRVAEKRTFWRENPLRGDVPLEVPGVPAVTMRCENDDTVVKELFWTDWTGWEHTTLRLWTELAGTVGGGVVLDVGAYSGVFALIARAAAPTSTVAAFDIQPRCVERIGENASLNGVEVNVELLAASDADGTATFYVGSDPEILTSVASITANQYASTPIEVPTRRLDGWLEERGPLADLRLVKIDVEGAEKDVLAGMQRALRVGRPAVVVEVNHFEDVAAVAELFPDGYRCFRIDDRRGTVRRLRWWHRRSVGRNYLFLPDGQRPPVMRSS